MTSDKDPESSDSRAERADLEFRRGESDQSDYASENPKLSNVFRLLNCVFYGTPNDRIDDTRELKNHVGRNVGRLQLLSILGRGGFSIVYRAYDTLLCREVAVKQIAMNSQDAAESDIESWLAEARAISQLSHPNIIPLYDVIQEQGDLFLVSELCHGPNLADWLQRQQGRISENHAAAIVGQLADALMHVHRRGLAHRDIKPPNVMLASEELNDQIQPYSVRLTDFGLVQSLGVESSSQNPALPATYGTHGLKGTIEYLAPEYILGSVNEFRPEGDIYALGVLFYRLITGQLPFDGSTPSELMKNICTKQAIRPRRSNASISRDLEAICLKCIARDPAARYSSAADVLDELERWKWKQPVKSRPLSRPQRMLRSIRNAPLESSLILSLLCLTITAAVVFAASNRQIASQAKKLQLALHESQQNAELASANGLLASQNADRALRHLFDADLLLGFNEHQSGNEVAARETVNRISSYMSPENENSTGYRLLRELARDVCVRLKPHSGAVHEIVLDGDRKSFLSFGADGWIRRHGLDGELQWERTLTGRNSIYAASLSNDGTQLAIGSAKLLDEVSNKYDNFVEVFDPATWQTLRTIDNLSTTVEAVQFSPDDKRLAIGCRYRPIVEWSLVDGSQICEVENDRRNLDMCYAQDGNSLIGFTSSTPYTITRNQLPSGKVLQALMLEYQPHRVALCRNRNWIAVSGFKKPIVQVYDISKSFRLIATLATPNSRVQSIAFSAGGESIAAGLGTGAVISWDLSPLLATEADGLPIEIAPHSLQMVHSDAVTAISVIDGDHAVAGCENGELAMFPLRERIEHGRIETQLHSTTATLGPDGETIYVGTAEGALVRFQLKEGTNTLLVPFTDAPLVEIAVASQHSLVVAGWSDGTVAAYNEANGEVTYLLQKASPDAVGKVDTIIVDGAKRTITVKTGGRVITLWEYDVSATANPNFRKLTQFSTNNDAGDFLAWPEVGGIIYGGMGEHLWHRDSDNAEVIFLHNCPRTTKLAYEAMSNLLLTGHTDGIIRIHRLENGKTDSSLPKTRSGDVALVDITQLAVSPDNRYVVSGDSQGEIEIWQIDPLRRLGVVRSADGRGRVTDVEFSSDGNCLMYHVSSTNSSHLSELVRWCLSP